MRLGHYKNVKFQKRKIHYVSGGNIRRLLREVRVRKDPGRRSLRRLDTRPRKAKYISGAGYMHDGSSVFSLVKTLLSQPHVGKNSAIRLK